MFQNILVPTDGSDISNKAVSTAARLAHSLHAKLLVLHVRSPIESPHHVEGGALVAAMQRGSDHGVLLIGDLRTGGLADMVISGQVGTHGDVVPGHEPEARDVDSHVVVPEAAAIPGRIVGGALDHGAAGGDFGAVGENAMRSVDGFEIGRA